VEISEKRDSVDVSLDETVDPGNPPLAFQPAGFADDVNSAASKRFDF
jgi:hypothetical protein